jgi:type VI protein secretion system component VasA
LTLELAESAFEDVDDMHLFGAVLNGFLSSFVAINTLFVLELKGRPSGNMLQWDGCEGARWLI